jgi:hypothetical protein
MTDYHNLSTPAEGSFNWDDDLNQNFREIDGKLVVRDVEANVTSYTPKSDALFLATDTEAIYRADGSSWNKLSSTGKNPTYDSVTTDEMSVTNETKVIVELSSDQSISANSFTTVNFDSETSDNRNEFDITNNKFVPDEGGLYYVFVDMAVKNGSSGDRIDIRLSDISKSNILQNIINILDTPNTQTTSFSGIFSLNSGNDIVVQFRNNNSSCSLNAGSAATRLSIRRVL